MAPELLRHEQASSRNTDIFSLGVLIYEGLSLSLSLTVLTLAESSPLAPVVIPLGVTANTHPPRWMWQSSPGWIRTLGRT